MNHPAVTFLLCVLLVLAIIFGGLVVSQRISVKCYDWWPLNDSKTCVVNSK